MFSVFFCMLANFVFEHDFVVCTTGAELAMKKFCYNVC